MAYCTRENLTDYVLAAYLTKADEMNSGCVERHIAQVAEEIDGALLQGGYSLPLESVPGKVKHIASVMAAYRAIGNITTLMASESTTGNEWIPLQSQYKQALKDLEAIRSGAIQLFPQPEPEPTKDALAVSTSHRLFGANTWSKY